MKTLKTNNLGKKYLEQCQKITIKELLKRVEAILKNEIMNIELWWLEIVKTKANYGWYRCWFKCPYCEKKVFTLYNIRWEFKCRKCSWLKYKKQRFKGMLEEEIDISR